MARDIFASDDEADDNATIANDAFDFVPRANARNKGKEGPKTGLRLRACISCRLIMSEEQVSCGWVLDLVLRTRMRQLLPFTNGWR
ncbi:hypothetical protein BdWA1_000592 [Babesia duncani]|uniref:Uncharacterized protein n=1 Tax=Babesia duncani TaxID=323732 RepID=A0AAD9UQ84_9APIC|nr:hypothetical protein BdWA1_000592 [Babesia duncani]